MRALETLPSVQIVTTTDQVFERLSEAIISLQLPPGTKVSEADIARELGVSRQPVRDAFYRLSELGFLRIRPQRATTITHISAEAIDGARFVRTALEVECLRAAIDRITDADLDRLEALLMQQAAAIEAGEKLVFHGLDDDFHRAITEIAGQPAAWTIVREQKAHLDRVRYLSLSFGAQSAFDDHRKIMDCLQARDVAGAEACLRVHLARILIILDHVRISHGDYFEGPTT